MWEYASFQCPVNDYKSSRDSMAVTLKLLQSPRHQHCKHDRNENERGLCVPNVWPAPDLQVDFCDLVSISLH